MASQGTAGIGSGSGQATWNRQVGKKVSSGTPVLPNHHSLPGDSSSLQPTASHGHLCSLLPFLSVIKGLFFTIFLTQAK